MYEERTLTMNDVAKRTRRAWIAGAAALAFGAAGGAGAQAYPAKPVKLIVAFGTGSGSGAGLISLPPPRRGAQGGSEGFAPVAHLREGPSIRPERWLWRLPERRACWW